MQRWKTSNNEMARRFDTIISWLGRVMVMVMIARTELSRGTRLWGPSILHGQDTWPWLGDTGSSVGDT